MVDDSIDMKPSPAADVAMSAVRGDGAKPDVDPARAALVLQWSNRVKASRKHWADAFTRMELSQQLAAEGADAKWLAADNYVVPIINRHINQAVAQLYAKNPKAVATRRERLEFRLWDGKPESLQAAVAAVQPPMLGHNGGPPMVDPALAPVPLWEPDPQAVALLREVSDVATQNQMLDRLAKTVTILWDYYTKEQASGFKQQMKALVRRTKVNSVAWVKLCFQRELEKRPEISAQIDDTTNQIARIEALGAEEERGDLDSDSPKLEELRLLLKQLREQESIIVREGPVFDWPRSNEIIVDKKCKHLKTLYGARWVATEFMMTPDEIFETYKIEIGSNFTEYKPDGDGAVERPRTGDTNSEDGQPSALARLYEVQDKKNGQFLTICEGYPDFIKEPAAPDVKIERFFTLFALVFNETENQKTIYPPADTWLLRHLQWEYNRAREALREHRIAAAPQYVAAKGRLGEADRTSLCNSTPHAVLEVEVPPGEDPSKIISRLEKANIDQNLYEVEQVFSDMQRTVGTQEANIGGTGDGTATESTIAENSRSVSLAENVDDLDEFLTDLAKGFGQICFMELQKDTVIEIVGPGAVWPDMLGNREDIAKDLLLEIKAGSSGRPNAAAELAKLERAMPYLLQMPGMNPAALARRYADLLELDIDDLLIEGLPSITALNQMMGSAGQATGDPATDPSAQGGEGAMNAPNPAVNEPQGQPAFPAGAPI